jgi:hypothetical protein
MTQDCVQDQRQLVCGRQGNHLAGRTRARINGTYGPKVNDFYPSLLRRPGCVGAMDRWLFRIFNRQQGTTWYNFVRRATIKIAEMYGIDDVSIPLLCFVAPSVIRHAPNVASMVASADALCVYEEPQDAI